MPILGLLVLLIGLWFGIDRGQRADVALREPGDEAQEVSPYKEPQIDDRQRRVEIDQDGSGSIAEGAQPDSPQPDFVPVSGWLQRESGPWSYDELPALGELRLVLYRALDGGTHYLTLGVRRPETGSPRIAFEGRVPPGSYRLRVWDALARSWSPQEQRIEAPASGLRFTFLDRKPRFPVQVELVDAESGERLPDPEGAHLTLLPELEGGVRLVAGNLLARSFAADARFEWTAWAGDHGAVSGDDRDLELRGDHWFGRFELSLGWACLLCVHTSNGAPVAGAEVFFDGVTTAFTDDQGRALVRFEHEPGELLVTAPGLRMTAQPLNRAQRLRPDRRGHALLVPMIPDSE